MRLDRARWVRALRITPLPLEGSGPSEPIALPDEPDENAGFFRKTAFRPAVTKEMGKRLNAVERPRRDRPSCTRRCQSRAKGRNLPPNHVPDNGQGDSYARGPDLSASRSTKPR